MKRDEKGKKKSRVIVEEIAPSETDAPAESTPQASVGDTQTESVNSEPDKTVTEPSISPEEKPETKKVEINEKDVVKPETKKIYNSSLYPWILIPGILLLGLLLGGVFAYYTGIKTLKDNASSKPQATPTVQPEATTSATSTPQATSIDLKKYPITILNGSGIKGEASKVQALLEKAGFSIKTTGNASSYDYKKTVIQAKESVGKDFLNKLQESLAKGYELDKNAVLKDSDTSSVTVLVGSSKVQ